jgi:hypothetical protein
MAFCRMVDFIYAALPLRPLRAFLIRSHMDSCPRCQSRLLSRAEAGRLFVSSDRVGIPADFWGRISSQVERTNLVQEASSNQAGAGWRWATAAATAAVVAVTGFWLLREIDRPGFGPGLVGAADRFQIDYVNVGGAPAQTFVYQPQGTDTVFVWAIKNP